jgi:hypothetical protein
VPGGATFSSLCRLTAGTVTVTSLSTTRAVGTLSGSGTCTAQSGATSAFTVTNGAFDLGIYAEPL